MDFEHHASGVRHLPEIEAWGKLRSKAVGRLAVDGPDIYPVNFLVDDNHVLYIRTSDGTKIQTIRDHPLVAFEADEVGPHPWSVVVKGNAEVIDDPAEIAALGNLAFWSWAPKETDVVILMRSGAITGREFQH